MVCIVRNPIEIISSYARAYALEGTNIKSEENLAVEFPEFWNDFVLATAKNMSRMHEYITEELAQKIPIHFIRYEDLV